MARGKKTSKETIYTVLISYATTYSYSETAKDLKLPVTTVKKIVDDNKDSEEFVKLCNEKKDEFVGKASKIIDKALTRLEQSIEDENSHIPINHLTTAIGTLYDKRALARGESTENIKGVITIEQLVEKVEGGEY